MFLKRGGDPCLIYDWEILGLFILQRHDEVFFICDLSIQSAISQIIFWIIIWISKLTLLLDFPDARRQVLKLLIKFMGCNSWQL